MAIEKVKLVDLQPTDSLRLESISFLDDLTIEQMNASGLPHFIETPGGILIADGNNKSAVLAKRGHHEIVGDYVKAKDLPLYFQDVLDIVIERANLVRKKGIYTPPRFLEILIFNYKWS